MISHALTTMTQIDILLKKNPKDALTAENVGDSFSEILSVTRFRGTQIETTSQGFLR